MLDQTKPTATPGTAVNETKTTDVTSLSDRRLVLIQKLLWARVRLLVLHFNCCSTTNLSLTLTLNFDVFFVLRSCERRGCPLVQHGILVSAIIYLLELLMSVTYLRVVFEKLLVNGSIRDFLNEIEQTCLRSITTQLVLPKLGSLIGRDSKKVEPCCLSIFHLWLDIAEEE